MAACVFKLWTSGRARARSTLNLGPLSLKRTPAPLLLPHPRLLSLSLQHGAAAAAALTSGCGHGSDKPHAAWRPMQRAAD